MWGDGGEFIWNLTWIEKDAILYASCFDANAGIFECLLGAEDAIISDELNHASIIDGIRLSKAKRLRYKHKNMEGLRVSSMLCYALTGLTLMASSLFRWEVFV